MIETIKSHDLKLEGDGFIEIYIWEDEPDVICFDLVKDYHEGIDLQLTRKDVQRLAEILKDFCDGSLRVT